MAIATHITPPYVVKKIFLAIFSSLVIYIGFQLIRYHYFLVTFHYPLEYREGAILFTTNLLLKG